MSVEELVIIEEDADLSTISHNHNRSRCCFQLPCLGGSHLTLGDPPSSLWDRVRVGMKKIREWSEIVAGPKWKTFIRRFNRHRHGHVTTGKFQYDPLSYALNFDEGQGQNGHFEDDYLVDFSSRFAVVSAKSSMDLSNGAPPS